MRLYKLCTTAGSLPAGGARHAASKRTWPLIEPPMVLRNAALVALMPAHLHKAGGARAQTCLCIPWRGPLEVSASCIATMRGVNAAVLQRCQDL